MDKIDISVFKPCPLGLEWYQDFNGSSLDAWNNCPRPEWMLWIAKRMGVNERRLCLAMGLCNKLIVHLMDDKRSRDTVKLAVDYGHGLIDRKVLIASASEAYKAMQESYKYSFVSSASHSAASAAYFMVAALNSDSGIETTCISAYNSVGYVIKAAYDNCYIDEAEAAQMYMEDKATSICREILTEEIERVLL